MRALHEEMTGGEFTYTFVEDDVAAMYAEDRKVATVYGIFTVIAIAISVLGLFSLSLFDVQQRRREIAIRKINGATTGDVLGLLLKRYLYLLMISFVIAVPLAWLAIHRYLEGFAYKTAVSWWLFAAALLLTAGVSLLTLIWQVRKAAAADPARVIRSE
jgi:ABC-type antimicrobial peptide transport system permease subunit